MKEVTNKDLDFYMETLIRFSEYNITLHYSDLMFADITDVVFRNRIIIQLAENGHIKAKQSKNFPQRYEIEPTRKGILFHQNGGYSKQKKERTKNKIEEWAKIIVTIALTALLTHIIDTLWSKGGL